MGALSKSLLSSLVDGKSWLVLPLVLGGAVILTGIAVQVWWKYKKRRTIVRERELDDFTVPVATVQHIWFYPLKACHRVEMKQTECLSRGLDNDRWWAITDKDGRIIDQMKVPKLATVIPTLQKSDEKVIPTLILNAPGMETLTILPPTTTTKATQIQLKSMVGDSYDVGDEASDWISRFTGIKGCRIYYMDQNSTNSRKLIDHCKYSEISKPDDETNFASYSPLFIVSQSSLSELNDKLEHPVPMTRFRPNIVVTGCLPHNEDFWSEIRIGDCVMRFITPGQRCVITTIDQESGEKSANEEPLKTLKSYRGFDKVNAQHGRKFPGGPLFGACYGVVKPGTIKVGDKIYVCKTT